MHRNNRAVEICISVAQTARLFTTMKRLHQQSIGQQARSPNPPYGREVHSNPQTVQWLLSLLESVHVCSLKCRIEPERWGCLPCYPTRNHNWASGSNGEHCFEFANGNVTNLYFRGRCRTLGQKVPFYKESVNIRRTWRK